ncbi:ribosomal subunit 39s family [Fusarium longipes]|uniref:Large ribosomal subunit protein mL50 n=1 Tax=Fusarium longipes TaxID=694270 RepID=A0A395SYE8_9HYPO|nr:ribosomal subunit 39s family [Fusarium longipes]
MPRIPRVGAFASLPSAVVPVNRVPFVARATFSTSTPVNALGNKTQWIRKQLWKGEAPGPEDPYNERPEPEQSTNLPDEAKDLSNVDRRPSPVRNTRLVLPPSHSEALSEKEVESVDTGYTPATSIEDLEEIEPLKTWWEQPGHWGEESEFKGFGKADRVQDQAVLEVYLRQALVESLSYQQRGLLEEYAAKKWPVGNRAHLDRTLSVGIRFENGKALLSSHFRIVTEKLKERPQELEEKVEISPEEARQMINALNPSWKAATLDNDHLKFAIRKRLYQLTGHFIPDVKLAAANTPGELITVALTISKRGKKLAEVLEEKKDLSTLPNVTVHSRRVTPIDREVSVGRWKVIEEELRKRDLPVTGTGGYGKNKERDWLTGQNSGGV